MVHDVVDLVGFARMDGTFASARDGAVLRYEKGEMIGAVGIVARAAASLKD
jgi:hypothetical protein